jgi:hypothetical protein
MSKIDDDKLNEEINVESDLVELLDKEEVKLISVKLFVISFFIFILITAINLWESYSKLSDERIQVVSCPKSFENNSPVLLKVIRDVPASQKDKWVKSFISKFFINQFPINVADAEASLKYVVDHSTGSVNDLYETRLDNIKEFQTIMEDGYFFEAYPKNSYDIRIRAKNNKLFVVQFEAYLIHHVNGGKVGKTIMMNYEVEIGDVTLSNPEGLYVSETNLESYKDYITGEKK